ncbi:hypothetical protein ACFSC3_15730 [Sphingomonas floccifaciens]|uniref:Uncharacterized protein n=1 Tax=Sphingomonas floccifaciens TaxID=1844115 RepID=A0ABW4NGI5_9SPHN
MRISGYAVAAIALGTAVVPAAAQERTATKQGFELPARSGKKILVFRPAVSVGAQSTGGMFEPNADWTDKARANIATRWQSVRRCWATA